MAAGSTQLRTSSTSRKRMVGSRAVAAWRAAALGAPLFGYGRGLGSTGMADGMG